MSNLPALATINTFLDQVIHCEAETLLRSLPDNSINAVITSPPYYGLRSYLPDDHAEKGREIGLEDTPAAYVERLVAVFREIRRVLRPDGVAWLNLGSSYAGSGKGGNPPDSPWSGFVGNVAREQSAKVRPSVLANADEPFALRDDLTPDEAAYVLSELARLRKGDEVTNPNVAVGVDEAIAPLTSGE